MEAAVKKDKPEKCQELLTSSLQTVATTSVWTDDKYLTVISLGFEFCPLVHLKLMTVGHRDQLLTLDLSSVYFFCSGVSNLSCKRTLEVRPWTVDQCKNLTNTFEYRTLQRLLPLFACHFSGLLISRNYKSYKSLYTFFQFFREIEIEKSIEDNCCVFSEIGLHKCD